MLLSPRLVSGSTALLLATGLLAAHGQTGEAPPQVRAGDVLAPAQLKGPHHAVDATVQTPDFLHEFTVTSEYGTFPAHGRLDLDEVIREVNGLYALAQVSKSDVFIEAAGESLVKVGKGAANAVTKPAETAKGIGAGVKRFGTNLGRRTKRVVDEAGDEDPELTAEEQAARSSASTNAAYSVLGVNSAVRKWAQKVQVDPYTANVTLKEALEGIAKVDAAGSLTTKIAIPLPPLVGPTATVGNLVWTTDPETLRKMNETRAAELGLIDAPAKAFFLNNRMTLTMQTRALAALHAVKPANAADYLETVTGARTRREALFYIRSAEMLQALHQKTPVKALLTDSRALVAVTRSGEGVVVLPFDWIRETASTMDALREMGERAKKELGATSLRIDTKATITPKARASITRLGWKVP